MSKDSIIRKGKYKGKEVSEVLKNDPQYILDMWENLKMTFSDEVLEEAQNRVEQEEHINEDKDYEFQRVFRNID